MTPPDTVAGMFKSQIAAAAAILALVAAPAAAQSNANFTITTGLAGNNVPGTPTTGTITGGINYSTFFSSPTGGSSAVTDFNVALANGSNYSGMNFDSLSSGINAVLSLTSGKTGTLSFFANNSATNPLFSFDLTNLYTSDCHGTLPGGGLTSTLTTTIGAVNIDAGSTGTLTVNSAVPEPATCALMLMGFGGMGLALRRKRVSNLLPQVA